MEVGFGSLSFRIARDPAQSQGVSTSQIRQRIAGCLREELLVSQRHHGIDSGGAPGWNEAGPKANRGENNNREYER